ncbi:hypothetical protein EBT23_03855 [bacterium]|nr:hypothetical protein [bacterium]
MGGGPESEVGGRSGDGGFCGILGFRGGDGEDCVGDGKPGGAGLLSVAGGGLHRKGDPGGRGDVGPGGDAGGGSGGVVAEENPSVAPGGIVGGGPGDARIAAAAGGAAGFPGSGDGEPDQAAGVGGGGMSWKFLAGKRGRGRGLAAEFGSARPADRDFSPCP